MRRTDLTDLWSAPGASSGQAAGESERLSKLTACEYTGSVLIKWQTARARRGILRCPEQDRRTRREAARSSVDTHRRCFLTPFTRAPGCVGPFVRRSRQSETAARRSTSW